jgi:hypothetical protein
MPEARKPGLSAVVAAPARSSTSRIADVVEIAALVVQPKATRRSTAASAA